MELGLFGPKSVSEARPPRFVKYSVTSESEAELAESLGEDSSSDEEERLVQLLRNMEPERAWRMLEKLRERRERLEQVEKENSPSFSSSGKLCGRIG